jgi:multidrug efflux system membrane fusion protein
MAISTRSKILSGLLAGAALFAGGLSLAETSLSADDAPSVAAAQPDVRVAVRAVHARPVRIWSDYAGRMNAVNVADIRPEVAGRITEVRFHDGDLVKAGDVLFVIDPRPYEVAVARARADLASARTGADLAGAEFARAAKLLKTRAASRSLYDQRDNARNVALAGVQAAEAALAEAELALDRAYVKAPIDGRASRPEVTLGNLVGAATGDQILTSIVSADGIYADFEIDEQTYVRMVRSGADIKTVPVELMVQGGDPNTPQRGTLYGLDNRIDTASGTIRARARFENADGALVPGMFVSIRVAVTGETPALTVPERAVATDQDQKMVFVVGLDDSAQPRQVELGALVGDERIVTAGLSDGDRVVIDGLQHVTPGLKLNVQDAVAYNAVTGAR